MLKQETMAFTVKVNDPTMDSTIFGEFSCYKRLTHRQQLERDRFRREFLGKDPESAPDRVKNLAFILSHLRVSLPKSPSWWTESDHGMELASESIVMAVWNETIKIQETTVKEDEERLKANLDVLKEHVKSA